MTSLAKLWLPFLINSVAMVTASGQTNISGTVKDYNTHDPLATCSVVLLGTTIGIGTSMEGYFKLEVPATMLNPQLVISYLGYESDTVVIDASKHSYHILLRTKESMFNEVVVTGVSKAAVAKENPVSLTVVSAQAIERTTQSNIIDVLVHNVPGLNAVKTGPNISKPFIRGLGYNRVLTLYDGVRQEGQQWGDEHGIEVDAYNIEKAEVIKGPSSLMYGSDALAGVVSLLPHRPLEKDGMLHGRVMSEYQSNNHLIGNGIRLSYSNDHWTITGSGAYRIAKNYTNHIDGRVYNTGFKEANASLTAGYTSKKGYTRLSATLYDNYQGIPDGSRDSLTRQFTYQAAEADLDDIKNRPIVSDRQLNSYLLSPLHQHIQHYAVFANSHYDVGKGNIDALLALSQNYRREYNHPTTPDQAGMYVRLNTANYSLRYSAPGFYNIETSVGINGMYQNNKNIDATDFPIPDYNLFDLGVYVHAKWKYQKWTVSGGVRYDIRAINGNDFYVKSNADNHGFNEHVAIADSAGAYLQFPQFEHLFQGVSFSLGGTYQANEHIGIKVNVARGYRSPNITEYASNGLDPGAHIVYIGNRSAVPEFSLQEDIGVTGDYRNVSASLSLFNNNIQNYIYQAQQVDANGNPVVIVPGNKTFEYRQAAAQLYGLEVMLNLHPKAIKGFSFNNSFSMVYAANRDKEFKGKGVDGEYLPFIPPPVLISSVAEDLKLKSTILPALHMKVEVEFNAAQNRFLALYNTETATSAYTLLSASIGVDINYTPKHTLQLMLQVNNLLDQAYQSNLSRLKYFEYYSQSPSGRTGMYSMGRNICAKLILPF